MAIDRKNTEYLHYGCEISLSQQENGYISSVGFIDTLLYLKPMSEDLEFSSCQFRILPFCIHSLQNELLNRLSSMQLYEYQERYKKINESLEGEINTNSQSYEKNRGECIRFGSTIYLQHVDSHKFLTVNPMETGVLEKDSLKVYLSEFPNDYSYIKIEPSFNFQKEGDGFVRVNDIVTLNVFLPDINKFSYLNVSARDFTQEIGLPDLIGREINASLDKKLKWRLNYFSSIGKYKQKQLNYGDYIWISHSEGRVVLSALTSKADCLAFFTSNIHDSNSLWKIERESKMVGGAMQTDQPFRLKHLKSGRYFSIQKDIETQVFYGSLSDLYDPTTLWKLDSIYDWEKQARVETDQFYFITNIESKLKLQGIEDSENLALFSLKILDSANEAAYFKVFKADATTLWETHFTINCEQILHRFLKYLQAVHKGSISDPFQLVKSLKKNAESLNEALMQMQLFLQHKLKSTFSIGKNYGQLDKKRQRIFREILIIDRLAEILNIVFTGRFSFGNLVKLGKEKNKPKDNLYLEVSEIAFKELSEVVKNIYYVIGIACKENAENQTHAFKFFSIFQTHAGYNLNATECMSIILKDNEALLSGLKKGFLNVKMGGKNVTVIDHYIWLLRKFNKERKPHLLQFLSDICCCKDNGITVNQERIHNKLFLNPETYNKVVISSSVDIEKNSVFVIFKHPSGIGEENVNLTSCFLNGEVRSFHSEINYFIKMLDLFANLCKERNYICRETVNKWFPIDMLIIIIWNQDLSIELRASCLKMLMSMHVDSQPRVFIKKPELIRTVDNNGGNFALLFKQRHSIQNVSSVLLSIDVKNHSARYNDHSIYSSQTSKRFGSKLYNNESITPNELEIPLYNLKCELIEFLYNSGKPDYNTLMLQRLKLANMLIGFSVISTECSQPKLTYFNPESPEFSEKTMDIAKVLKGASNLLFHGISSLRMSPFKLFKSSSSFQGHSVLKKLKSKKRKILANVYSEDPFRHFSEGLKHYLSYHTTRSYDNSEVENIEILCKLELCDILNSGIDLRHDFLISNIIAWFKLDLPPSDEEVIKLIPPIIRFLDEKNEEKIMECFVKYHKPAIEVLTCFNPNIVAEMLKQFVSTKNYKLQTKIMGVVLRILTQRKEMAKNLTKLTLMPLEEDPAIFLSSKIQISALKSFSEQAEIICKYWKQADISYNQITEKINSMISLLEEIQDIFYYQTNLVDSNSDMGIREIDKNRQLMLKALAFDTYIIKFIKEGFNLFEDIYHSPRNPREEEAKSKLSLIFRLAFAALKLLTTNNRKIQKSLMGSLGVFLKTITIDLGQIQLICEIFRENYDLCNQIDDQLLTVFTDMVLTEGRQARFLQFFKTVIVVNKEPLHHLQRMILAKLTHPKNIDRLLFMDMGKFVFTQDLIELSVVKDEPYDYHASLIELLAKCGLCTSAFILNRLKCQKLISISECIGLMMKDGEYVKLRKPLYTFIVNVHLNGDGYDKVVSCDELYQFIELNHNKLRDAFDSHDIEMNELEGFVYMISNILKMLEDTKECKQLRKMIKAYTETLIGKIVILNKLSPTETFQEGIGYLGDAFSVTFVKDSKLFSIEDNEPLQKVHNERWLKLVSCFTSPLCRKMIKKEQLDSLDAFKSVSNLFPDITEQIIFRAMLEFISQSIVHKPPIETVCSVIEFLGLSLGEVGQSSENLRKMQNWYSHLGAVNVVLDLICDPFVHTSIFSILIEFSIGLLTGGNENIQQDFYEYFISAVSSEIFFMKVHCFISDFTANSIDESEKQHSSKSKKMRKLINHLIKLLQLFCENHYEHLQNYLRNQEKSRISYDLLGVVIELLRKLMLTKQLKYFFIMSNCFEMLTECMQGPCQQNQKAIINSKFLELANDILSINENSDALLPFTGLSSYLKNEGKTHNKLLKGWMVSQLKYRCLVTLNSLLEGRIDNYATIKMFRAFNLNVFKQNIISVYSSYLSQYKPNTYDYTLFNHLEGNEVYKISSNTNAQDLDPKYHTLIIEVGFMIFHLICEFSLIDDYDIQKLIQDEFPQITHADQNFTAGLLEGIGKGIFQAGTSAVKLLRKIVPFNDSQEVDISDAIRFFQSHTGNIEFIFKGIIYRTFFWLPPPCLHLTNEAKEDFQNKVDRSSEKAKLEYLVKNSKLLIEDMEYEEKLNRIILYRYIGKQITLCKILVFILTLYLNVLLLYSYSAFNPDGDRLYSPSYGNIELASNNFHYKTETLDHIFTVGLIHCIFSGFIFLYFTVKSTPLLISREWRKLQENGKTFRFKLVLLMLVKILLTVDVLYQLSFFACSLVAIVVHPFFFSLHLLDILYRVPSLQSVVMAVVHPWRSLLLILLLIVVICYGFAIWAYSIFYDYFDLNCQSLLMCFKTVIDQGYKNSGGVGMWIDYAVIGKVIPPTPERLVVERYFFDDLFMIIIVILMGMIILGQILDTFTELREIEEERTADKEKKCFICGKEKEEIERITSRPFKYHTVREHNEFTYIFFIAYLTHKKPTEYSGIESYIKQLVDAQEVDWIPQHQGLSFKSKLDTVENSRLEEIRSMQADLIEIEEKIKTLNKKFN